MLVRSVSFALRRMLRGYIGYAILIALPLGLITINGLAFGNMYTDQYGRTAMDTISVGIIVGFQLVGGFYSMETMKSDLYSPLKWRLLAMPYPPHVHAFSIYIASSLYSVLNGTVMVLFTHWIYDVFWGNIGWAILVLALVSLVSQLFFMMAVMAIRRYKTAELVGYAYVFGLLLLAGYFFVPVPETGVVGAFNAYVNPLSLGENAIVLKSFGKELHRVWLSVGILAAEWALLSAAVVALGRRRLA